jgi:hypothetical protein
MGEPVGCRRFFIVWAASCLLLLALSAGRAPAGEVKGAGAAAKATPAAVSFYRDIRPVLRRSCQGCHQPSKGDGKLVVTSFQALKAGGRHGAAFEPGKAAESLLLRSLTGEKKPQMPKGKPPLSEVQIDLFRRWINEGAADDTPDSARQAAAAPAAYPLPPVISALAFSPDGSLLAVAGCHEVVLHRGEGPGGADDPLGSAPLKRLPLASQRIECLVFSPDGRLLAAAGGSPGDLGEVQLWSMPEGKAVRSLPVSYDSLFGASFSADGSVLALGCADNSARLIKVADGSQVLRIDHHQDWVFGAMFSVDQKHLITVSRDRAMKLTEVASGSFIDNVTSITPGVLGGGLQCLARHPREDKFATGGEDGIPRMYKIVRSSARQIGDDDNLLRAFEKVPGVITAVAFSPDGARLAVGATEGEGRVYDVADGKKAASLSAGPDPIFAVAYRADNRSVALGGKDGQVRLFEVPGGKLLRKFVPVVLAPPRPAAPAAAPVTTKKVGKF